MTLARPPASDGYDRAAVALVERAVAQNLLDYVRALRTLAPESRAEAVGCAGGVAAFMGSGSPLTTVKGAGPEITDADIDAAETFFRRRGVEAVVFELAPWVDPTAVERLSRRGYAVVDSEDVVLRRPPFDAPVPAHRVVTVDSEAWSELMLRMNQALDLREWPALTRASAALPDALRFAVLDSRAEWIACAEVLPAMDVGLFANDATLESARGRGAQTAAIHHRLRAAAAQSFALLAAEVAPGSTSERNYLRCGFHLAYARAHYARAV